MASWLNPSMPRPRTAAATGPGAPAPARRRAAPSSSPLMAASPPPSAVSPRIRMPLSFATFVLPYWTSGAHRITPARCLDDLRLAQTLGQLLGALLRRLPVYELALGLLHGLEEALQGQADAGGPDLVRAEAQIGGGPSGDLLAGGRHDLLELGVAGLPHLVADSDQAGETH